MKLDPIDRRILRILQRDGRKPNNDLAREVGLSPSPCLRRVRLLEESGIIERYAALLDASRIGMGFTVFVRVWLTGQDEDTISHFVAEIGRLGQVVECHLMAGDCDCLLRVVAEDLEGYRRFQAQHLGCIKGIRSMKSDIPMQRVKLSWELPLSPDPGPPEGLRATRGSPRG
jgi:DNA-binding Lrp family transcriptional regulator